jgi:drug/metabolite transporter (DMT)-like permease
LREANNRFPSLPHEHNSLGYAIAFRLKISVGIGRQYVLIEYMRTRTLGRTWAGLPPAVGLLLLSGLWTVSSLRSDLLPHSNVDPLSPAQRQAALYGVFAVLAATVAVARRLEFPRGRLALACAGIGIGLFVLPSTLAHFADGIISNVERVAVFSLTPVFAVILQPYLQSESPSRGRAALAGSICAVAGILFLFPLDIPNSFRTVVALCLLIAATFLIAATNCYAVRFARTFANGSSLPMAALAGATSATCFAMASVFSRNAVWHRDALTAEFLGPFAIDLLALFLLFWLMLHLATSRMAARFLIAPLFTILVGAILQPPSPPGRAWLGIGLLAGGAAWLVFAPAEQIDGSELEPLKGL